MTTHPPVCMRSPYPPIIMRRRPTIHVKPGGLLLLVATCVAVQTGCQKPLLSPRDERTQYDRFDSVRNEFAGQEIEDDFGRKRPNLRARLTPKG